MTTRIATCRCGQLKAECEGEPLRISVCHCLDCQQRSGSAFAAQARFPVDQVRLGGNSSEWTFVSDSGRAATFYFCPTCGAQVWYRNASMPGTIAIPIGTFADPDFPAPLFSVWETRKHAWVQIAGDEVEHYD